MVTTRYSDQQGSKSRQKVMRLYKRWHRPTTKRYIKPPLLHIRFCLGGNMHRIGCQPQKTTLQVQGGQSRLWSAEQGKENKIKSLAAYPPPPPIPQRCSLLIYVLIFKGEKRKKNHATHLQALRKSRSVSRPYKYLFGSSTRPMGVASQNSTPLCAITSFPVSLLLSSPGDV